MLSLDEERPLEDLDDDVSGTNAKVEAGRAAVDISASTKKENAPEESMKVEDDASFILPTQDSMKASYLVQKKVTSTADQEQRGNVKDLDDTDGSYILPTQDEDQKVSTTLQVNMINCRIKTKRGQI